MEIKKEDWEGVKEKSLQLIHEAEIGLMINKEILALAIAKIGKEE